MDIRYSRNLPALTEAECAVLQKKHVCVVGCGGLGGYVIELLARVGIGALTVVDGDVFDASNLNRQLLCDETVLGMNKAAVAVSRVFSVNSTVSVTAIQEFLTAENAAQVLEGCDLVVDALDSARSRHVLANVCGERPLRVVHGAISGWYAQVTIVEPRSGVFDKLYPPRVSNAPKSGNLPFIAAVWASVQADEVVKLLIGRTTPLLGKLLLMDFKTMEFTKINI